MERAGELALHLHRCKIRCSFCSDILWVSGGSTSKVQGSLLFCWWLLVVSTGVWGFTVVCRGFRMAPTYSFTLLHTQLVLSGLPGGLPLHCCFWPLVTTGVLVFLWSVSVASWWWFPLWPSENYI